MAFTHPLNSLRVPSGNVAVQWFGQSSFALKTPGGTVAQLDPFFPRERQPGRFVHPLTFDESTLRTDFVLLTHSHSDHTCIESLRRIADANPTVTIVGPFDAIGKLADVIFPPSVNRIRCDFGGKYTLGDAILHPVHAKPPEGDLKHHIAPPDVTHLGFVIEIERVRLWFSGDPIRTFAELDETVVPVRALAPQIGFITTHPTDGEFPFFEDTVQIAQKVGLSTVIPQHYDCFAHRTFDPQAWAASFPLEGPQPRVLCYDQCVLFNAPS